MKKTSLLLPLLLLIAGCVAKAPPKVGLCTSSMDADYLQELSYEIRRSLNQRGIETEIRDANLSDKLQMAQIEGFIQDYQEGKLAALIVMPADSKTILPALVKAQEAGVPLFTLSTGLVQNDQVKPIANIGVDDEAAGRLAAKMLMAATGNKAGKVLVVTTSHLETCNERVRGFTEALKAAKSPTEVVRIEISDNARDNVSDIFKVLQSDAGAHQIIGIFASLDPVTLGAMTARNLSGREADIRVVGQGGSAASRNAVNDGLIFGTVEHSIPDLAAKTALAIGDFVEKGIKPEGEILVPVVSFTAEDAKALHAQHQKKQEEETARLEKIRKEAADKNRDEQDKEFETVKEQEKAKQDAEKAAAKEAKSQAAAKKSPPPVFPAIKEETPVSEAGFAEPAIDKNAAGVQPAADDKHENILQQSLDHTDTKEEEADKLTVSVRKLEKELEKSRTAQPAENALPETK